MSAVDLPPVEVLRERAQGRVDALRPVVATGGALLIALEVSGGARFALAAPADEIQARSLLVALLPKVLAWRSRQAAGLGPEHEVLVAAGRAVLAVPADRSAAAIAALWRDAQAIRDGSSDALALDVAWCDLTADALDAGGELSFVHLLDALLDQGLETARLRRADGTQASFWSPEHPAPAPLAALDLSPLGAAGRIGAAGASVMTAEPAGDGSPALGIAMALGASIDEVAPALTSPRLLMRIDGLAPDATAEPGDEIAELPLAGVTRRGAEGGDGSPLSQGVLCLDLDALGRALHDVATGKSTADGLRDRLVLSEAVAVACGPIADAVIQGRADLRWILASGDHLCLAGAASDVVEVAAALREAIVPGLKAVVAALGAAKAAQTLDLSAGLVIAPSGVPLAHLVSRAEVELRRAKGERRARTGERRWKRALSWDGVAVGWHDWGIAVELGRELAGAIEGGRVPRGLIRRLAAIHALWRRHEDALEAGAAREAAAVAKRRWLWAHGLSGVAHDGGGDGAGLLARLSRLALEDVDEAGPGAGRKAEQEAAAWLGMVAGIAHWRTREERG